MVWVYDRTKSLLVVTLMHASLIASTLVILTPVATGMALVTYWLILAAVLWAIVAAIVLTSRRKATRKALHTAQPTAQPDWRQAA